jgi:hypothetical protein
MGSNYTISLIDKNDFSIRASISVSEKDLSPLLHTPEENEEILLYSIHSLYHYSPHSEKIEKFTEKYKTILNKVYVAYSYGRDLKNVSKKTLEEALHTAKTKADRAGLFPDTGFLRSIGKDGIRY